MQFCQCTFQRSPVLPIVSLLLLTMQDLSSMVDSDGNDLIIVSFNFESKTNQHGVKVNKGYTSVWYNGIQYIPGTDLFNVYFTFKSGKISRYYHFEGCLPTNRELLRGIPECSSPALAKKSSGFGSFFGLGTAEEPAQSRSCF